MQFKKRTIVFILFLLLCNSVVLQTTLASTPQLDVLMGISDKGDEIIFDWNVPVKHTALVRGNKLWVIFDKKAQIGKIHRNDIKALQVENISQQDITSSHPATFILINLKDSRNDYLLTKQDQKLIVKILKSNSQDALFEKSTQYNFDIDKSHTNIIINGIGQKSDIISYTDPFIGDEIFVVPTTDITHLDSRNFVDFDFLDTLSGIAIQKLSDNLRLSLKKDKLYIFSTSALNINIGSLQQIEDADNISGLYQVHSNNLMNLNDYVVKTEDFLQKRNDFYLMGSQAVDAKTKITSFLNLSLFLFANGWYNESNSVFRLAYENSHGMIGDSYVIKTLAMAINFMCHNFASANAIGNSISFKDIEYKNTAEVRFWHNLSMIKDPNNESKTTIINHLTEQIQNSQKNFLSSYPDHLLNGILLMIIETIALDNTDNQIFKLSRMLLTDTLTKQQKNHLHYYLGKFLQAQGSNVTAQENFKICSSDHSDVYSYTHCDFERLQFMFKTHEISRQEYINTLQKLSSLWRDGNFELQVLSKLASVYYSSDDISNAIRTWKTMFLNTPNSSLSLDAMKLASQAFIEYFEQHNKSSLSNLAFFYEFKDFTPLGSEGDAIIMRVVNDMIELDLLSDAANVMKYQIQNRLLGIINKEKAINEITNVYIQLGDANKAIETIDQYTDFPFNKNNPILVERKYIYAKALVEDKQYMEMYALLYGDESPEADVIRANGFFTSKNWEMFNDSSEPYLYSIRYSNERNKLSVNDNIRILHQLIAYFNTSSMDLFNNLYLDFKPKLNKKQKYTNKIKVLHKIANDLQDNNVISDKKRLTELKQLIQKFTDIKT